MKRSDFVRWQHATKPGWKFPPQRLGLVLFIVLVAVLHAVGRRPEPPQTAGSTPAGPPFDLVWDTGTGVDANSLPLNPMWRFQKNHPGLLPDFRALCGSAFQPGYDRLINYTLLVFCTSQGPTPDFPPTPIPCDLSTDKVLAGHLNWAITTQIGKIHWSGYDNFDGDFNLELTRDDRAGETALNLQPDYGIHLEFKGTETMSNFMSPYWVGFYNQAIQSHDGEWNQAIKNLIDGRRAVVTGLLGLDGVHGGYTESHPVFSLAIETGEQSLPGAEDISWAFFLRNQGSEGCCSNHIHQWDGLSDVHGGSNWYFIQLPAPEGALGATVSVVPGTSQIWANNGLISPVVTHDAQFVYLGFRLPEPNLAPELDGVISLHYFLPSHTLPTTSRPKIPLAATRIPPRGDDWEEVRKHMRPEDLNKLDNAVRASQLALVKPRPHTVRLVVPSSIGPHQPLIGPGQRGQLTRTKTVVDPIEAAAREQLHRNVQQIVPKEFLTLKR